MSGSLGAALDAQGMTVEAAEQREPARRAELPTAVLQGQLEGVERRIAELSAQAAILRRDIARRRRP